MKRNVLLCLLLVFLLFGIESFVTPAYPAAFLQAVGRISGKVVDTKGNPIPNAKVVATAKRKLIKKFEAVTDKDGKYVLMGLEPGTWQFTVSAEGYQTMRTFRKVYGYLQNKPLDFVLKSIEEVTKEAVSGAELLEAGNKLYNEGKYEQALEAFNKFLAANPDIYNIHVNVGNCYLKLNKFEEAQAEFEQVIEKEPDCLPALYGMAEALIGKGDLKNAETYVNKVVAHSPNDPAVYYNFGEDYFAAGKTDEAIALYKKAIEINPNWEKPYLKLGYALLNKGDTAEAVKVLKKFLELAPNSPDAPLVKELLKNIEG
ncbi:MAG: tetratricopeptide repeat protein [Acidobacteria bacterium]|nr:tetratricopeptide repeat protein [Acidobacteriota bacterium]